MTHALPRRPFPRSGDMLSVVGFGGIILMNETQKLARRVVAQAVDRGVNYFDVAPMYGNAEERLGPALQPYRDQVFLACKTYERTAKGARADLDRSLARLRTDHFDLYQLHALTEVKADVDRVFAASGAMKVIDEARRAGVIRHIGISVHSEEAALAAMSRYDFDSVLFPVNYLAYTRFGFGPGIMAEAERRGMARLALKAMARGRWREADPARESQPKLWYEPLAEPRPQELAVRFTLGMLVTAMLPPGTEALFWRAVEIAEHFQPLKPDESQELAGVFGEPIPIFGAA